MLSVVTFKWATPNYRAQFAARTVNVLRNMVARHYPDPHRFICITDDAAGLMDGIEVVPLWSDLADVPNPTGGGRPSCYRRLKLFDPAMRDVIGSRYVMLDLDTIVCGDLRPVFNRTEDIVLWRSPTGEWPYNGAMYLANAGARPQVWRDFDRVESPRLTHAHGYRGSDQAWISYRLGPSEPVWTEADGVRYYGKLPDRRKPPADARIIFTTGGCAPWKLGHAWVRQHWR